jgi:hypothetical protein
MRAELADIIPSLIQLLIQFHDTLVTIACLSLLPFIAIRVCPLLPCDFDRYAAVTFYSRSTLALRHSRVFPFWLCSGGSVLEGHLVCRRYGDLDLRRNRE